MRSPAYAVLFASLGLLALGDRFVAAQDAYPSRTVTLTIGFAAGGNGDIIARIVAEGLTPRLGQTVVVENRARQPAATSRPRGSPSCRQTATQLIAQTGGHAVSGAIYKSLPFDPVDDFQMISTVGYQSFMIAVRADNPIKTVADLVAAAKAAARQAHLLVGRRRLDAASRRRMVRRADRRADDACAVSQRQRDHDRPARRPDRRGVRHHHGGRPAVPRRQGPRARRHQRHALVEHAGRRAGRRCRAGLRRAHLGRHRGAEGAAGAGPEAAQ